jgi:tRNA G26 N,N-dimethylase Trm1
MQAVLPSFMAYLSNIVYVIRGPGAFCSAKITQKHKIKVQEEKSFLKKFSNIGTEVLMTVYQPSTILTWPF